MVNEMRECMECKFMELKATDSVKSLEKYNEEMRKLEMK